MSNIYIHNLAVEVARELNQIERRGWKAEKSDSPHRVWAEIVLSGRVGDPRLTLEEFRGKVTITGIVPYDHRISTRSNVEIGVSARRGAGAIAAEISRRLLPQYLRNLQQQLDTIKARDDADTLTHKDAVNIARVVNGKAPAKDGQGRYRISVHQDQSRGFNHGSIDVGRGSVRLEMSVTPETAIRMLKAAKA